MKRTLAKVALGLVLAFTSHAANAADYPDREISIIVPYGPGGVTDVLARTVGTEVSKSLGQPVIVLNRPGAGTTIGIRECAEAKPDGYTLCVTVPDSLSYAPLLYKDLSYDPGADFSFIANLAESNNLLVAGANAPFDTFKDMIAYAKANPGKLNWGTWGTGTLPDVYRRWVNHTAGLDITGISYAGMAPVIAAIQSGEVDIAYMGVGLARQQMKDGKVKPLVMVGAERSDAMPDLPSFGEEGGDPGLSSYFGLYGPAGIPAEIIEKLNAEFNAAMSSPDMEAFLKNFTLDAVDASPADFEAFVKKDQSNSAEVFKLMGIDPSTAQ